jgi:hypothetical protein
MTMLEAIETINANIFTRESFIHGTLIWMLIGGIIGAVSALLFSLKGKKEKE